MSKNKTFAVIGLGRFGMSVASKLNELGQDVLAIDESREKVEEVADMVTHSVIGDAADESLLRALGAGTCDCAIVATGDIENSVLITLTLKNMGVKTVVCKARSAVHAEILRKLGADRVVFPEHELAVKLAQTLSSHNKIVDYLELSPEYGLMEVETPQAWLGSTIARLNIRAKYGINIVAVNKADGRTVVTLGPDYVFEKGDSIVAIGLNTDLNILHTV